MIKASGSATALSLVFVAAAALAVSACRSPISAGGGASLYLSLGGAIPRAAVAERTAGGIRRAIIPSVGSTLRVRIDTGESTIERSFPIAEGSSGAEIQGLPPDRELAIEVAALDASSAVATSWSGSATLQAGPNSLPIVLAPPASSVVQLSVAGTEPDLGMETHTLAAGSVRFYEIAFQGAAREWQIMANSGSGRWLWMQAYDADWLPLDPIASDPDQGWTVVSAGGGSALRIAVANTVASPGYPAGNALYELQARQAYFTTPTASPAGTGTSADPTEMSSSVEQSGISIFLQEGDYAIPGALGIVLKGDIHLYGGFSALSWKTRDSDAYETWIAKESLGWRGALNVGGDSLPASGRADGLRLVADPIEDGNQTTNALRVELIAAGERFVISDCVILGSRLGATSGAYSATGLYAASQNGMVEVTDSKIEGAASAVQGSINASSYGVSVSWGAAYIHDSDIDGGYVRAGSGSSGNAWGIYGIGIGDISLIVAGNRIWGGRIETGNNGSSATGVYVYGPVGAATPAYIANNVISAGYSNIAGNVRLHGIILEDSSGEIFVVGNTVDGGSANASTTPVMVGIRSAYANQDADAVANSVYVADGTGASGATKAAFEADFDAAYFRSLVGNTSLGPASPYIATFSGTPGPFSNAPSQSGNVASASTPSSAFRAFRSDSYSAAVWFADNDLRFATAFSPGARVAVSAYIGALAIAAYPALGLDAAGASRPADGLWYRGAYEP